jgi:hypothetical protein
MTNPAEAHTQDAVLACAAALDRMQNRRGFEVSWLQPGAPVEEDADGRAVWFPDLPVVWTASAQFKGRRVFIEAPDPGTACDQLITKLVTGGLHLACGRKMAVSTRPHVTRRHCLWSRVGDAWLSGCGRTVPPPA